MEPKEEPDWEAQPAQRRNRKSWADMVAEEKKETAKKDDKHEEKDEWWKREWKKSGKSWDDWWEDEETWHEWYLRQRMVPDSDDTGAENSDKEKPTSSNTWKKNRNGSQKERAKRRWLMDSCKNESQEEKEKVKLGALGTSRMKRLLSRQEDRKNKLEAAQLAQAAAANAAAAAQAAQATAAAAQWHQWQMQQAQLEAQAMWHQQAYQAGQLQHQWGWHGNAKQHRGLVCTDSGCLFFPAIFTDNVLVVLQDQWPLAVLLLLMLGLEKEGESNHSMHTAHMETNFSCMWLLDSTCACPSLSLCICGAAHLYHFIMGLSHCKIFDWHMPCGVPLQSVSHSQHLDLNHGKCIICFLQGSS